MDLDPKIIKELLETFNTELNEQAQVMIAALLKLEHKEILLDEKNHLIDTLFRSAHNLKGAAAGLGINHVHAISHALESLFSNIKQNKININSAIIDLSLNAVDKMQESLAAYLNKQALSFDIDKLIAQLNLKETIDIKKNNLDVCPPLETYPRIDESKLSENDTIIKTSDEKKNENDAQKLESTNKVNKNVDKQILEDNYLKIPIEKIDKVTALMEEIQSNKIAITNHYAALSKLTLKTKELDTLFNHFLQNPHDHSKKSQQMSHMMNDHYMDLSQTLKQMKKDMRQFVKKLDLTCNTLQSEIRLLRLVPVGNFLCTLPRYVRDVSQQLNKNVTLQVIGEDVKLDKYILEHLKDPIMHLIRNAIDHGIEEKQQRIKTNKPEAGLIAINIIEEGNEVVIEIKDDGKGIDLNQVKQTIQDKKLLSKEEMEQLNDHEILDYIFKPGFSTRKNVTHLSGRGVGLDVVKTNINELKGTVTISSKPHQSTTFSLRVPLTLSSERGILLSVNNSQYIIPTTSIERIILNFTHKDIINVGGTQAIIVENKSLPIRSLAKTLQDEERELLSHHGLPIIIIKNVWGRVGFIVDAVLGEREFVIKRLKPPLNNLKLIVGVTLLEKNEVIAVLNPNILLMLALESPPSFAILKTMDQKEMISPNILLVDDSITTRTLEKNILESKHYHVTVAVNGKEALDLLQKSKFSLIITDISMPIMDGFQLTEHIKHSQKLHDIPVIIVTSLGSDAEKARGIEVGADAYIVKNEFESDKLLQIIEQLV